MVTLTGMQAASFRMSNQQITGTGFGRPGELVRWMGCIQAQDYSMAKWALGCRLSAATDSLVEAAFNAGEILRTHVLRPTWHFVHPADIRWMLALSAPRIRVLSAPYHLKLGIDQAVLRKSRKAIAGAFAQRRRLTRDELVEVLGQKKVAVDDGRAGLLLMDAELDALICSAGRVGKKFAYQLLDHVTPTAPVLDREEALGELARRYFSSRGPASLADFAWWGGLTTGEARVAQEQISSLLQPADVRGKEYWFVAAAPSTCTDAVLLPAFDEFAVGYKDRRDVLDPHLAKECNSGLRPVVVYRGQIVGTWHPAMGKKKKAAPEIKLFPRAKASRALAVAVKRYENFLGCVYQGGTLNV